MKAIYNKYYTGYILIKEIEKPERFVGKFFEIGFEKPHSWRSSRSKYELIIYTNNEKNSYKALDLLRSSIVLQCNGSIDESDFPFLIGEDITYDFVFEGIPPGTISESFPGIYEASVIASKCSFSKRFVFALHKYRLATGIYPLISNDFDPNETDYIKLSEYLISDHLKIGLAITQYYSILEQLNLHMPPNQQSTINNVWNPLVKRELENKLLKSKINLQEPFDWILRSTPTRVERKKKPPILKKSKWASSYVRDSKIEIIDAIRVISYIRSCIAAHKSKNDILSLSVYDLMNARLLTRRLFMECLGLHLYHVNRQLV